MAQDNNKRLTVAFFGQKGNRELGQNILSGILEVLQPKNFNLLSFPIFPAYTQNDFSSQQKILTKLVSSKRFDGLICWTSQLDFKNKTLFDVENFIKKNPDFPLVSINKSVKGHTLIDINEMDGIEKIMEHLIFIHKCKKIGFIRGPEHISTMNLRYNAYKECLKKFDLSFNPYLVTKPTIGLQREDTYESINFLLKEKGLIPGRDIDAIITPSDFLAIGAIEQLINLKVRIPEDIAVTGFNNRLETMEVFPAITSIDVNFKDLGFKAATALLNMLEGRKTPEHIFTETKLIIRRSCGCKTTNIDKKLFYFLSKNSNENSFENENLLSDFLMIKKVVIKNLVNLLNNYYDNFDEKIIDNLLNNLYSDIYKKSNGMFLNDLKNILDSLIKFKQEFSFWQMIIDEIRNTILLTIRDNDVIMRAENIFHSARTLINEKTDNKYAKLRRFMVDSEVTISELSSKINTGFNIENFLKILESYLPKVGFSSYYISIFDHYKNNFDNARLIYGMNNYKKIIDNINATYNTEELLPDFLWNNDDNFFLSVIPLYFNKNILGIIILEKAKEKEQGNLLFEELQSQLSSALEGASIFQEKEGLLDTLERVNVELAQKVEERTLNLKNTNIQLENAINAANYANESKTKFLSNMSHEMRTPLNCIMGFIELIKETNSVEKTKEYIDIMMQESTKLITLINNVLDISKIESGKMELNFEQFSLYTVLNEIISSFRAMIKRKNIKLVYNINVDISEMLIGDSFKLSQVLKNLISNAFKFTEKGSINISVNVKNKCKDDIILSFTITDTGIGIPENMLPKIFDEFEQVNDNVIKKYFGTGLGLSISKNLVELMGGEIGVKSKKGEGTTFWFNLPFKINNKNITKNKKEKDICIDIETIKKCNILVAEDYHVNQKIISFFLQSIGCKFSIYDNGEKTIENFNKSDFDLILMDIQMPDKSGVEVTKIIRETEKGKKIPIVAMTANAFKEDIQSYLDSGMNDIITKPFHKEYFKEKILEWLKYSLKNNKKKVE
ncbi:MAG: substrate-binding domain-containing protein [Spirochaetes bacterium]|nr:substrate-binding domain-containing protein [Spirochaetota bacterium]